MVIILDKAGAHKSVKDLDFRLMAWTNITIKLQDLSKGKKRNFVHATSFICNEVILSI